MKKFKYSIILMAALFLFPAIVSAKEEVKIYMFKGEGCSHCAEALEFFDSIEEEYGDKFELTTYEVWYNEDNADLMQDVAKKLGDNVSGVPYIVVESESFGGYDAATGESIKALIDEKYENENHEDVVAPLAKGISTENKKDNKDTVVIVIFLAIVAAIIGGAAVARKKM